MRNLILGAILGVALVVSWAGPSRAEKHPEADGKEGKEKSKVAELFKKLDTDHDGKLSKEEFSKMYDDLAKGGDVSLSRLEQSVTELSKDEGKIDLFKGALDLTIYTIIVFLILFVILRAYAWGPIAAGLDKRERSIAHDRAEADKAKQEAGHMRQAVEGEKAKAAAEVRAMLEKARADAEAVAAEREAQGKAAVAAERDRMKHEAAISESQARKDVLEQGAQLASLISAKVIKKNLSYEDHRALIGEALAEFRAAGAARKQDIESATA